MGRIAHGSMPFLGDSAIRHMAALLREFEETLYPALANKHTAMPVVPPRRAAIDHEHQLDPRRPAGAGRGLHRLSRARRGALGAASSSTGAT